MFASALLSLISSFIYFVAQIANFIHILKSHLLWVMQRYSLFGLKEEILAETINVVDGNQNLCRFFLVWF